MKTRYVAARIAALALLLFLPLQAFCYYNPSTGRWLTRDPLEELRFEPKLSKLSKKRSVVEMNAYCFVGNLSSGRVDFLGLTQIWPPGGPPDTDPPTPPDDEPAITWASAPCPNGQGTIYIQVLYGGIGPYRGPRVDDGSAGFFGGGSKGCPDYKTASDTPGVFQDTPRGLTGPVEFIVCRVCTKPCCAGIKFINGVNGVNSSYPISGYSIVSVGPCVHWKKGDNGDLSDANTFKTFPGAPQAWTEGMNSDYPGVASGKCTPTCGQ